MFLISVEDEFNILGLYDFCCCYVFKGYVIFMRKYFVEWFCMVCFINLKNNKFENVIFIDVFMVLLNLFI